MVERVAPNGRTRSPPSKYIFFRLSEVLRAKVPLAVIRRNYRLEPLAESEPVHFAIRRDDGYVALGFVEGIVAIFERGFSWRGGFVLGAAYCVYAKYCFRETSRPRRGLVDRNRKFAIP
jgi:hypothetical protein